MDKVNKTNHERWNSLASANVQYSQPLYDIQRFSTAFWR